MEGNSLVNMNIKFIIEYKGTNYSGWQIQKKQNTIQGELKKAFQILLPNQNINIIGSGRTDAGVHATGQVASVNLPEANSLSVFLCFWFKKERNSVSNSFI